MKDAPTAPPGDDSLREAWRSTSRNARPRQDCPEPESILAAAEGTLDRRTTAEIVDHTATCAACAEAWRLGAQLLRESDSAVAAPRESAVASRRPLLAVAAAVLVGVLGVWIYRALPPDDGPTFRGGEQLQLPREEFLLRWPEGPENAPYRLTLSTPARGHIGVYEGLEATEFLVPERDLADLADGSTIQWRVEQKAAEGVAAWSASGLVELRDVAEP